LTTSEKRLLVDPNYPNLSITAQCNALGFSRSSFYYDPKPETLQNLILMRRIEELHYALPDLGYRRIHANLRREGYDINDKRVKRLWRVMGFESILPKKNLSKPDLSHLKYPYLLNGMTVFRPNQIFSSDITFLPTSSGFVYLVIIMDWYSRYILSWEISNTISSHFCIEALKRALKIASPEYFNTDQGSQFTSHDFLNVLKALPIKISMDGKGRAIDNVYLERGWWSLKYEKIYLNEYKTVLALTKAVAEYVDYYNARRPHQALLYATPQEIYHGITPKYSKGIYHGFEVKRAKV